MYRERQILTVLGIDGWNEAVAIAEEVNKLCAAKADGPKEGSSPEPWAGSVS